MYNDDIRKPVARPAAGQPIELDDYFADRPAVARPVELDEPLMSGRIARRAHELSDEDAEAVSRVLVRIVPLAYAGLLGALADHPLLGLALGVVASLAFDWQMGRHSLARGLLAWVQGDLCPRVMAVGRRAAAFARRHGMPVPALPRFLHCA